MYVCLFHALGEQREIYAISVESGWYYLGPAATNGYRDAVGIVLIPEGSILRPVGDWAKVWDDAGSGNGEPQ